ncbi:MAG: hypothetical protein IJM17_05310 [Firmicutes bacterium]|nr:hypothetical protein [Bacillota bacterium]
MKINSKLIIIILLSTILVLSGCGGDAPAKQDIKSETAQAAPAESETSKPAESAEVKEAQAAPEKDEKSQKSAENTHAQSPEAGNSSDAKQSGQVSEVQTGSEKTGETSQTQEPAVPSDAVPPAPVSAKPDGYPLDEPYIYTGEDGREKKDLFGGYFNDSLFIGDSRSVGIVEYGNVGEPTAFCNTGLSVYNYDNDDLEVNGFGKISLAELLELGSFDRIYIGLGINELGYKQEDVIAHYSELLDIVKANQPQADIYLLANLHVTYDRSRRDKIYNNGKIDSLNELIKGLTDGTKIMFIDGNPLFDDGEGNLSQDYTGDNTHLYARFYPTWTRFIYENTK